MRSGGGDSLEVYCWTGARGDRAEVVPTVQPLRPEILAVETRDILFPELPDESEIPFHGDLEAQTFTVRSICAGAQPLAVRVRRMRYRPAAFRSEHGVEPERRGLVAGHAFHAGGARVAGTRGSGSVYACRRNTYREPTNCC